MYFTRDPIIETIMTPKEGHKLSIRSSKGAKAEEYLVDAVEVISFGNVYFFRSLERPKAFLLPLSDYEVIEVRELKVPLKATSYEKAIKIPTKKEAKIEENTEGLENASKHKKHQEAKLPSTQDAVTHEEKKMGESKKSKRAKKKAIEEKKNEARIEPPKEKKLVPPPATLISETINRYKTILLPEEVKNPGEEVS